MKQSRPISLNTIHRLPRYLRVLDELDAKGIMSVSSIELAEITGQTASQIRQDINYYGNFGLQGYGYSVRELRKELIRILGADRAYKIILIGAGHLGTAILENFSFIGQGYTFQGAFDIDPAKIGRIIGGQPVYDAKDAARFIRENGTDIAILTTPRGDAQSVAEALAADGIRAIWNFTGVELVCDALVENIHFSDSLLVLTYKLNERDS